MTRTKYILPDGRPLIGITPGTAEPKSVLTLEIKPSDPLWEQGQPIPGTQRRFVCAERSLGL